MGDPTTEQILLEMVRREWLAMDMPLLYTDQCNGAQVPELLPTRRLAEKTNGKPRKRRWDAGKRRRWVVAPARKRKAVA